MDRMLATQVLLALEDDRSFWFVSDLTTGQIPRGRKRFVEGRTGWQEQFEDAVQIEVRAGRGGSL